jgi:hypothetical protein
MRPQSHPRLGWVRFAVGAFALGLMLVSALRAPAGVLAATAQHTAGSLASHGKQPCLESPGFDWTVPQNGFSLLYEPHRAHYALGSIPVQYSPGPVEFRLYNRPPPLS